MAGRGLPSPDSADALNLTFAEQGLGLPGHDQWTADSPRPCDAPPRGLHERDGPVSDTEAPNLSVMLLPADDGNGMEVTVFDGDQVILEVSLIDMVAEWADLEALDGELHPYLDDTLNVLSDMTYAIIKVVEQMEKDDPHRAVLLESYTLAYDYAQRLVEVLTDE